MTAPWWTRAAADRTPPTGGAGRAGIQAAGPSTPVLIEPGAGPLRAAIAARIPSFTPEWTRFDRGDAGVALVRLFGTAAEPIVDRLNRLGDQAEIEHLRVAGVEPLPVRPARIHLQVELAPTAPRSVLLPTGFAVSSDAADGSSDPVVFETERSLWAAPAVIDQAIGEVAGGFRPFDLDGPFDPFGSDPRRPDALWLGLAGSAPPTNSLAIAFELAGSGGAPSPVERGGPPIPAGSSPLLSWEILDGTTLGAVEVLRDETTSLTSSGVVELRLPRTWRPGHPPQPPGAPERRWIRIGLVHGAYPRPPRIEAVRPNVVPALAARTVRDEPLEPLSGIQPGRRTQMQLANTPVVPGSLQIEVDLVSTDIFGTDATTAAGADPTLWSEVADLGSAGPADQVFTLDSTSGIAEFGDGINGRAVPVGFRNVRARRYLVGSGRAGAIEAAAGPTALQSLPFIASLNNPAAATGGVDGETASETRARGPRELRSRGRAVTADDYALLAGRAPGAEVTRAWATPGHHPALRGAPLPGVVGVYVVGAEHGDGPPIPDGETLAAVADFLTAEVAPLGVRIVTAPPRFHDVQVNARVELTPGVDVGTEIANVLGALDTYLHPLRGGERGSGPEPGADLRAVAVMRRLLGQVPALRAIPQLNFVVDGVRHGPCQDVAVSANGLPWPGRHEIVPVDEGPR